MSEEWTKAQALVEAKKREWHVKQGGYAFGPDSSMSLRDYFAAQALGGMMTLSDQVMREYHLDSSRLVANRCAEIAYCMADAMLQERAK